ncbi:hypothetical protein HDU91_000860, partial [Kappamyces sp. JEL0680]
EELKRENTNASASTVDMSNSSNDHSKQSSLSEQRKPKRNSSFALGAVGEETSVQVVPISSAVPLDNVSVSVSVPLQPVPVSETRHSHKPLPAALNSSNSFRIQVVNPAKILPVPKPIESSEFVFEPTPKQSTSAVKTKNLKGIVVRGLENLQFDTRSPITPSPASSVGSSSPFERKSQSSVFRDATMVRKKSSLVPETLQILEDEFITSAIAESRDQNSVSKSPADTVDMEKQVSRASTTSMSSRRLSTSSPSLMADEPPASSPQFPAGRVRASFAVGGNVPNMAFHSIQRTPSDSSECYSDYSSSRSGASSTQFSQDLGSKPTIGRSTKMHAGPSSIVESEESDGDVMPTLNVPMTKKMSRVMVRGFEHVLVDTLQSSSKDTSIERLSSNGSLTNVSKKIPPAKMKIQTSQGSLRDEPESELLTAKMVDGGASYNWEAAIPDIHNMETTLMSSPFFTSPAGATAVSSTVTSTVHADFPASRGHNQTQIRQLRSQDSFLENGGWFSLTTEATLPAFLTGVKICLDSALHDQARLLRRHIVAYDGYAVAQR